MKIYVCGGSNSFRRGGWTDGLIKLFPGRVRNASIGATSSLMGVYRCLSDITVEAGDILIWEYALNDQNHIDQRGYGEADLLPNVEALIRLCAERNVAFIPLILVARDRFFDEEETPYRSALKQLFAHYGLDHVDMTPLLRQAFGDPFLAINLFDDPNHMRVRSTFVEYTAQCVAALMESYQIPDDRPPLRMPEGQTLHLGLEFQGGIAHSFLNNHVSVLGYGPEPVLNLKAPVTGELFALVVYSSKRGGGMALRVGDKRTRLSLVHDEAGFYKPMLKLI